MFRIIYKKIRAGHARRQNNRTQEQKEQAGQRKIQRNIDENIAMMQDLLGESDDIVLRIMGIGPSHRTKAAIFFVDGMVDQSFVQEGVIKPLVHDDFFWGEEAQEEILCARQVKRNLLYSGSVREAGTIEELAQACLDGNAILLIDGLTEGLFIGCQCWEKRSVAEPQTETTVRGPREGFNENLRTNTSLLRRKIRNPGLIMESIPTGERTKTKVCVCYIRGLAEESLVEEVKRRVGEIKTDAILASSYIEQYIEDNPRSIFNTIAYTEKPEVVAANLLEGRVGLMIDGCPFVLTMPMLFIESFQTEDDYASRPVYASMIRIIRYIAYAISVLGPAIYVAVTTFHQELIPTPLLFTMIAAREGVPFPAAIEALIMMLTFEVLREAGIRLPRPIGQAISIVGALVMGDAAVSAGIVGTPMVIVVAITAVSSFVVPTQADAGALLRFMFLALANFMGGFGIVCGSLWILVHLTSIQSFGVPYLAPLAPLRRRDMKDALIRAPFWKMRTRPEEMAVGDPVRQAAVTQAVLREKEEDGGQ